MDDAHGVRDVMGLSGMSYDNTGQLGANSWRHVAFIEQTRTVDLPMPTFGRPGDDRQDHGRSVTDGPNDESLATAQQSSVLNAEALSEFDPQTGQSGTDKQIRWLMSSDVCKHCTHAGCLDVCPTGALFRTEFGTVVVQGDICNGCGYCVPSCPYGVIEQRKGDGRVFKCTMCYDRLTDGLQPGVRDRLPDAVDPVRQPRRAAGPRRRAAGHAQVAGRRDRPALRAGTRTTASAARGRSSCCSTSRRSTACRRTRSSPRATCPRCGSPPERLR
jgi:Fe-S-cluster-containing hydrogenase component 2